MSKLSGKVAIVTGAGQGVGRGIALALAKENAVVVIAELNPASAVATADEIEALGGTAKAVQCDVRHRSDVKRVVEAAVQEFGTVDILVNNAVAVTINVPFEEMTDDDMALAWESGALGTLYFMQACFPYMKERGGKIINISSAAGLEAIPGMASYAAAKEGMRAFTRVAAREWGRFKINVNIVCPFANSPGGQKWSEDHPEQFKAVLARVPLGRMGDCEQDIGRTVVYLAGPDSDFLTGNTIMVDGGMCVVR